MFLVANSLPRVVSHTRLATIDDALRIFLVVDVVAVFCVVITYHIDCLRIFCLVAHHHTRQGTRDWARRVYTTYHGSNTLGNLSDAFGIWCILLIATRHRLVDDSILAIEYRMRVRVVRIIDFVAHTPEEYARVVAVASHHVSHIAVDPFLEEIVSAIESRLAVVPTFHPFLLREFPFVTSLVHHEQSLLVTNVVEHWSLWIMTHANGIRTHSLQFLHLSHPYFARNSRTEHTCVVVQTHTLHLHPFAIKCKSFVGIELQRAQTHTHRGGVDNLSGIAFEERYFKTIQIWALQVPELWIVERDFQCTLGLSFCQTSQVDTSISHLLA